MNKTTDRHGRRLKAYAVQGYEHGCIVFASNSATARRQGAGELGDDWEGIEYCRRAPWADAYVASRRVPPLVMIENGWWFECGHCGRQVSSDSSHYDISSDEEILHQPVADGDWVYCTPACQEAEARERAQRIATKEAVTAQTQQKFPGVAVIWASDSGPGEVHFTFPGSQHTAYWKVGTDAVSVARSDLEAWDKYHALHRQSDAQEAPL